MEFPFRCLMAAWEQVSKGSRSGGIDGITVDLFASGAFGQLQHLQQQLNGEVYAPLPAKGFYKPKSSGGKRLIGIQTVRDSLAR